MAIREPVLALSGLTALARRRTVRRACDSDRIPGSGRSPSRTLDHDPKDAINVFDFEPVARKNIPPAHFGYMASGIDDEVTLRANREGFLKFQLRPRRLVDVSKVDMSTEILGVTLRHADHRRARSAARMRFTPRASWLSRERQSRAAI